jgi:hypothetical protein
VRVKEKFLPTRKANIYENLNETKLLDQAIKPAKAKKSSMSVDRGRETCLALKDSSLGISRDVMMQSEMIDNLSKKPEL